MKSKTPVYLVSQNHWDREWYMTFEQFRFELVRVMDLLLDLLEKDARFKHFVLDGQTSVLEDYLEIRPERREEICRHVRTGRIRIGPWYTMPDLFLVSGESLIRNLLLGRRMARPFGGASSAGYVPDPFGHPAQMPQIFLGLGIDSYLFMRGMPAAENIGAEFRWQAPDKKSEVFAVWMQDGYANASMLGYPYQWGVAHRHLYDQDRAIKQLGEAIHSLEKLNRCGAMLFLNGADHLDPQSELPDILREARKRFPEYDFRHATFEDYLPEVRGARRRLKIVSGELRSSYRHGILPGVLSTRMYLKRANRHCEGLLERWAEPTSTLARHLRCPDHAASVRQAWKYLLQNHPHDSICGCSVDAVHRENVIRFEKTEQLAESVIQDNLKRIGARIDTRHDEAERAVFLWNPLPGKQAGALRTQLTLPAEADERFRLVRADGSEVPVQVTSVTKDRIAPFLGEAKTIKRIDLTLDTPTAGLGYETLWMLPARRPASSSQAWERQATPKGIDTNYYRIRFHSNGTFDLYDKKTRRRLPRQLLFEDTEDAGDEYDYSKAPQSKTYTTERVKARIRIVERGLLFVTYEVALPWKLPVGLEAGWKRRSKKMRAFPIKTRMRVYRSHRRIEFSTQIDNQVKDHRLRVHFAGPARATHSVADGHFGLVRRPIEVKTTRRHQFPEPTTFHQRFFTTLSDGRFGAAVLNRHLPEYEILEGQRGSKSIAVTLLRSVQYLAHDRVQTRPGAAGPQVETPEAQCLGPQRFEYAFMTFEGGDPAESVTAQAESYASPVRLTVEGIHKGRMPAEQRFVSMDNEGVVFSAWKPAEKGRGSVLRIYNPSQKTRKVQIDVAGPLRILGRCDLKEDPVGRQRLRRRAPQSLEISLKGYEIVSLKIG